MFGTPSDTRFQETPPLFAGVFFTLAGFDPRLESQLVEALEQHGAVNVGEYGASCTHVIVPRSFLWDDPVCAAARDDGKHLCSEFWVSDSLEQGVIADVDHVVYRPLRDTQGIPGTKKLIVCLTGYQGPARRNVMRMVQMMGAHFSKPLVANRITHLVCYKFEGEKYNLAKQLGLKLVNHQWLENCLKTWSLLPEDDYARSGLEVELAEAEAKDSEDDGNLKPAVLKDVSNEVLKGGLGGDRRFESEVKTLGIEVNSNDNMKISSNILSPQNVGSTIEISGVISKVDATSVLQIEGMDGNGALPQIEGMDGSGALPQIEAIGYLDITSSKQQKVCVGVDIDDTSVRHENEILDGDKNAETCFLNGHDDVSCVDRNIASFVTPLKGNGDEVEPDVAFRASTRNDGDVSVPEGTPLSMLFSDFEKTPTDRAFHTDSTSRMKLRQSMRAVSRVSDKKKPGRQSRKTELAGTPGEEILPAGFAADVSSVNDKRSTGILKVSSNLKKHHTKDIANENTSDREEGNEICMVNTMSNCDVQQVGQEPVIAGNLVIDGNELDNGDRDVRDIVASPSCIADNIDRCDSVKTDVRMSRARQQGNLSIGSKVLRAQRKRVLTEETLVEEKISSPVHNSGPVNDVKQKGPSIREVEERQLTNEADCKKKLNGRKTASVRKPKLSNAARKNNEMSVTSELVTNVLGLEDSAMLAAAHKDTKHDSLLSQVEGGHVVSDVDPALKYNGRESRLIRKEEKKSSSHAKDNEMTVRSELTSKALGRRKNTKAAAALINQGNESNIDPSSRASEAHMNQENVSKMDASETPNLPSVSVHININSEKECQPSVMDVEDSSNRGGKQSKTSRTINTTNKRVSTSKRKAAGKENVSEKNYGLLYENKIEDQSSTGANQKEVKGHQSSDQKQQKITPQSFFAFSGRKIEVKPLQAIVKKLGGKICRESHQWSHQTTHLIIVGRLRRTEKLFAAAAAGRWILRDDYVRDSGEAGVLLDEMKYEWYGSGMTEDGAISFEAPRKWREHRERTNCCALEGLRMLLYGECIIPSLDTLRRALRAGGAELVATCPPYTKMLASGVDFAIVNPGTPKNDPWVREFLSHNIACVTTDFFVEFICKPSSSLERHTLYDTHRFVRQALDHHVANGERSKTEQKSIEDREVEDEGICCVVCGQSDREDVMLLCGDDKGSGCGTAMHTDCCNPPLKEVPPHDWYCTHCTKSTPASKRTKRRKGAA